MKGNLMTPDEEVFSTTSIDSWALDPQLEDGYDVTLTASVTDNDGNEFMFDILLKIDELNDLIDEIKAFRDRE